MFKKSSQFLTGRGGVLSLLLGYIFFGLSSRKYNSLTAAILSGVARAATTSTPAAPSPTVTSRKLPSESISSDLESQGLFTENSCSKDIYTYTLKTCVVTPVA